MVKRQMEARNMNTHQLAKAVGMSYAGLWQMFKNDKLKVQRLAEMSEAMQYNFFRELAQQFPYTEPVYTTEEAASSQVLQTRIKELELEIKVLKEAIVLMRP